MRIQIHQIIQSNPLLQAIIETDCFSMRERILTGYDHVKLIHTFHDIVIKVLFEFRHIQTFP